MWRERIAQECERGRERVVSATRDRDPRRRSEARERRHERLEHERAAACRADRERVARAHAARLEHERGRAELGTDDARIADLRGRFHGGEVLPHEPRPRPRSPDLGDAKPATGRDGKRERAAEQLPAALAARAIDLDQPFTHTTCLSV